MCSSARSAFSPASRCGGSCSNAMKIQFPDLTPWRENPAGAHPVAHPEWAMCLGGASCVWDDVLAWEKLYGRHWDGLVIAANDIGSHWPRDLHHWVTLHPAKFSNWCPLRERQGFSDGYVKWGRMPQASIVDVSVQPWAGGSSGMLAAQVAVELGCTRTVLCGIPMTDTPHFPESTERFATTWTAVRGHWQAWEKSKDRMVPWVRSMSGRTAELLGVPSMEWLLGTGEAPLH